MALPSRRKVVLVALALVSLALPACGGEDEPEPAADCGFVAFTPRSDDGAFGIRARGIDCTTARKVASAARATRVRPGGAGAGFETQGFDCAGSATDDELGLPGTAYRCTRGDALVTFTRN